MAFRIQEAFEVGAPMDRVWRYLIDPRQVVECLPGAELTQMQDERTFLGKVKVKVGPVTTAYSGKAMLAEVNEQEHRVRISAEGRESAGSGSARMTMTSTVVALPSVDGRERSEVRVEAELDVAGKIVQFGRGMIEAVNQQLFTQFTACVRGRLEAPVQPAAQTSAAASSFTAPPPPAAAPADATRVASPTSATHAAAPVRIVPLLFRALFARLAHLFGRG